MAGAFGAHALAPRLGEKAATWVRFLAFDGGMGGSEEAGRVVRLTSKCVGYGADDGESVCDLKWRCVSFLSFSFFENDR
jgi:hypothetical protein